MKLYKTTYIDDEYARTSGRTQSDFLLSTWLGTQADARALRKRLLLDGMRRIDTVEVDVPTSKPELLGWLNNTEPKEL